MWRRPALAPTRRSRKSVSKGAITAAILLLARLRLRWWATDVLARLSCFRRSVLERAVEFFRAVSGKIRRRFAVACSNCSTAALTDADDKVARRFNGFDRLEGSDPAL